MLFSLFAAILFSRQLVQVDKDAEELVEAAAGGQQQRQQGGEMHAMMGPGHSCERAPPASCTKEIRAKKRAPLSCRWRLPPIIRAGAAILIDEVTGVLLPAVLHASAAAPALPIKSVGSLTSRPLLVERIKERTPASPSAWGSAVWVKACLV